MVIATHHSLINCPIVGAFNLRLSNCALTSESRVKEMGKGGDTDFPVVTTLLQ